MRIVVNKKYKQFQVMGALYRYISYNTFTCNDHIYRYIPVSIKKSGMILLSYIFEPTVSSCVIAPKDTHMLSNIKTPAKNSYEKSCLLKSSAG